jgi:hypothetical protein
MLLPEPGRALHVGQEHGDTLWREDHPPIRHEPESRTASTQTRGVPLADLASNLPIEVNRDVAEVYTRFRQGGPLDLTPDEGFSE